MLNRTMLTVTTVLMGMGLTGGAIAQNWTATATSDEIKVYSRNNFQVSCVLQDIMRADGGHLSDDFSMRGTQTVGLAFDLPSKTVQQQNGPKNAFIVEDSVDTGRIYFETADHLWPNNQIDTQRAIAFNPQNGLLSRPNILSDTTALYLFQCHPA